MSKKVSGRTRVKQSLTQAVKLTQEPSFDASCLPETSRIATLFRDRLLSEVEAINTKWPYHDRVLVWLLPTFLSDVRKFHEGKGRDLGALFAEHQLQSLDRDLSRLLQRRIRELQCKDTA